MGIRIHKQLGYGLTDVEVDDKQRIVDARFNQSSRLLTEGWDDRDVLDEYVAWVKDQNARNKKSWWRTNIIDGWIEERDKPKLSMSDSIIHQREYGIPEVVLLTPPGMTNSWSRYDDAIDYVEETYVRHDDDGPNDRVDVLDFGIYPFNASFMDDRVGEKIDDLWALSWVRAHWPSVNLSQESLAVIAHGCGFSNVADAEAHFRPLVPIEVRMLAEWADLFSDPDAWRQLRPMLYTYWS